MTATHFWQLCLAQLEKELSPQQFNTWIRQLTLDGGSEGLRLLAPNRFVMQWIKDRFIGRIEDMARQHYGFAVAVSISLVDAPETRPSVAAPAPAPAAPAARKAEPSAKPAPAPEDKGGPNPAFTFANFVTGKANQLARAAGLQVAENPGKAYNPLLIYGGAGLGKTHLIQAIGNRVREHHPDYNILYVHAERYISDVVRAYQHKAFDEFKRFYRSLDLLLIDDIQFLTGKSRTQEEFFYLFNTLFDAHKQVVITCDTYPKEISGIEERLISRLGWGLTVALEPPELEMRVAILLSKAEALGFQLDENVAFFIAKHIRSNVRELEGALNRIVAYAEFHRTPDISVSVAKDALQDLIAHQNRQISIENIQKTVADYYKIKISDMHSRKRSRIVARPRQVAMALAKELTPLSLPEIGASFGGRDHTTVLHACRQISTLRATLPALNHDVNFLLQVLRS
jgi:chromosomal replication initiator protein